ncbi:single-stranded-DNA-specific exonuclease RecJ [soil metagenome]
MQPSEIIKSLLTERGVAPEDQAAFMKPDFERDQHDGSKMRGMKQAVERLAKAKKERIVIFGDYDADGVPATALLVRCFKQLGFEELVPLIPLRSEGYGLTSQSVERILAEKPTLLVTVDNGTVAKDEVATLAAAGVDVIVIDHHEPQVGHVADAALAIINPKQEQCPYPFKELCGCGLAWKMLWQLALALKVSPDFLKWELDMVALSTIADLVPLVGENRLFATYGLQVLGKTRNLGLQALAGVAGIELASVSAGDVGFKLAPRINAPSRMHRELLPSGEHTALTLFLAATPEQAAPIAQFLNAANVERQALVDSHVAEAHRQAQEQLEAKALVVFHESWSTGVIGLVASKLVEVYKRPAVVLALEGGVVKGSVRSIGNVHAVKLVEAGEAFLERYGGHAKAAGLTFRTGAVAVGAVAGFRELVQLGVADASLEEMAIAGERKAEAVLLLSDVTLELAQTIQTLEPFGIGFPQPVFALKAQVESLRAVGRDGTHLSCFLVDPAQPSVKKKAIGFGMSRGGMTDGQQVEVLAVVTAETWQGVTSPNLQLKKMTTA